MRIKIQSSVFLRLFLFCLIPAAMTGCGPSTAHVGTYIAEIKASPHHHETTLELKETGVGVWRVGDDEVTFSWYVKGNELRLNTKNGGVIVGSLDNGVIHVTLPGSQELFFKKVK
ncbi:MAG: hypothetical protein ABSF52_07060 [Syntrophobacteraceae bacterium]